MSERPEYASEATTAERLREMLPDIERFLGAATSRHTVEFGWGCEMPTPELWKPVPLLAGELCAFVAEAESKGFLKLGQGDLIVRAADESFDLTLCHESDIHLVSSDQAIAEWFSALLKKHQLKGFKRPTDGVNGRDWDHFV